MTKKSIDYETVYRAVHDDHEAQLQVLEFYDSYINSKSIVEEEMADGNIKRYVDPDIKAEIQAKVLEALPKCKVMR